MYVVQYISINIEIALKVFIINNLVCELDNKVNLKLFGVVKYGLIYSLDHFLVMNLNLTVDWHLSISHA